MLQDRHIVYPHLLTDDQVLARIDAVLQRSPNRARLTDPANGFSHAMWRWCLEYDLNPAWALVSLQRERSLLGRLSENLQDWLYAFGYVGHDGAGTINPRWNGLVPQLWLCIHQSAWIGGFGAPECYGVQRNLRPGATRWNPLQPSRIQLYEAATVRGAIVTPASRAEHLILTYTPHAESIPKAGQLLEQFAPEFL